MKILSLVVFITIGLMFVWLLILPLVGGLLDLVNRNRYKIKRFPNNLTISGFCGELSVSNLFIIRELLCNFIQKELMVMLVSWEETEIGRDYNPLTSYNNLQEDTVYYLNKEWSVYFARPDSSSLLKMLYTIWQFHHSNGTDTVFFGCAIEDIPKIMLILTEAIKNTQDRYVPIEEMVKRNISTYFKSVLFNIGSMGHTLHIHPYGKKLLDEIESKVKECFSKDKNRCK